MLISYKWLQTYFDKPLPEPLVLADILTMGIFEIEGVSEVSSGVSNNASDFKDTIIDVKVLPDRASYCLSHRYIAQEVGALIGQPVKFPELSVDQDLVKNTPDKSVPALNINIDNSNGQCKRYIGRRVNSVNVVSSPDWLKSQLEVLGQRSINTIVDLTNYVMLETGQPLHAFDADKVEGDIVVRNAKDGEEIMLLDGTVLKLDASMLVIADSKASLALAGVKGGKKAEVTSETKNIILESACFDSTSTRKTAQKVGIRNESSKRFENGVTPERAELAMNSLSVHIAKLNSDAVFGEIVDVRGLGYEVGSGAFERRNIEVSISKICDRLGVQISKKDIVNILASLDLPAGEKAGEDDILNVSIPVYRPDILITEDVVDEVGRVNGYEKIKGVVPKAEGNRRINKNFYYHNVIRKTLLEEGFSEVYTYTLTDNGDVVIQNPLTVERGFMRSNISDLFSKKFLPNIKNADLIGAYRYRQPDSIMPDVGELKIKMFEIGKIFGGGAEKERYSLAFGIAINKPPKGFMDLVEIENVARKILDAINNVSNRLSNVAPRSLDDFHGSALYKDIKGDAQTLCTGMVVEFDLDNLITKLPDPVEDMEMVALPQTKFQTISQYPFSVRDIAVFVPGEKGKGGEVLDVIKMALSDQGKKLLVRDTLFDEFAKQIKNEGDIVKTSYAYRLVFQANDRTLTDEEVSGFMGSIGEAFKVKGWEVR